MQVTATRAQIVDAIADAGVIAVIRLQDPSKLRAVVDALAMGGIRAIEVTMTVPGAIDLIDGLVTTLPGDVIIGAGTVLDPGTAARAIRARAAFIVSPIDHREVLAECHRAGRVAVPGCFSPTEIYHAWDAGADIVKVFPATPLGPGFFRDVLAPLPQVKLMPTGGVSLDNAGEWIRAGAVAVGVGSALVDPALIAAGDFAAITDRARRVLDSVRSARHARR